MAKFRMKALYVEARQWDGTAAQGMELARWVSEGGMKAYYDNSRYPDGLYVVINTLNGPLHASPQDWLVKGVGGEFSVYKPDVFAKTCDPA